MFEIVLLVIVSKLVDIGLNLFFALDLLVYLSLRGYVPKDKSKSREETRDEYIDKFESMDNIERSKEVLKVFSSLILSFAPVVNICRSVISYNETKDDFSKIDDSDPKYMKISEEDVEKIRKTKGLFLRGCVVSALTSEKSDIEVVAVANGKPIVFKKNNITLNDSLEGKYTYDEVNELTNSLDGYVLFTLIDGEHRAILSCIDLDSTKTVTIKGKNHDLNVIFRGDAVDKSFVVYPWSSMIRTNEKFKDCLDDINAKRRIVDEVLSESTIEDDKSNDNDFTLSLK